MGHWDPIGVHGSQADEKDREAYWDEYDDYIPAILDHLESGGDRQWLEQYLFRRRTGEIGLHPDQGRHFDAAAARAIYERNPKRPA